MTNKVVIPSAAEIFKRRRIPVPLNLKQEHENYQKIIDDIILDYVVDAKYIGGDHFIVVQLKKDKLKIETKHIKEMYHARQKSKSPSKIH